MDTEREFCPECQRMVTVAYTQGPGHASQANIPDSNEPICLDFRPHCGDCTCPLFGQPGVVLGVRLARSGLSEESFERVTATCVGCGGTVEMEVLSSSLAYCPSCGTTNRLPGSATGAEHAGQ